VEELLVTNASDEAEREVEKAKETLAMAERVIELSRKEQERLSSNLPLDEAAPVDPPAETP
jgi:hypothetical protein